MFLCSSWRVLESVKFLPQFETKCAHQAGYITLYFDMEALTVYCPAVFFSY